MWKRVMNLRKAVFQYGFTWNYLHILIKYYYNLHKISSDKKYNSIKNMKVILDVWRNKEVWYKKNTHEQKSLVWSKYL